MEHCARAQCRHSGGFSEVYFFAKGDFFVLIANHESAASTTCAPSAPAGAAPRRRSPAAPRNSRLALTSRWSQLARPSAFPLVRIASVTRLAARGSVET
jgi:hypothetical protein